MKFSKDEYLNRCNQDQKTREIQGDILPYITLKHYGTYGFNANEKPKLCDVSIEINADKISGITNLQLTLELKASEGVSKEYTLSVPPFSLNTLGVDMYNNSSHIRKSYIDIPMYNRNLCDFHDLTYSVKSATAILNGKQRDLLKEEHIQVQDK